MADQHPADDIDGCVIISPCRSWTTLVKRSSSHVLADIDELGGYHVFARPRRSRSPLRLPQLSLLPAATSVRSSSNSTRICLDAVLSPGQAPHLPRSGFFGRPPRERLLPAPRRLSSSGISCFSTESPKPLRGGLSLLVEGSRIKSIATGDLTPPEGAQTIDCGGRVMMPGLIDAHWHTIFAALSPADLFAADVGYTSLPQAPRPSGR